MVGAFAVAAASPRISVPCVLRQRVTAVDTRVDVVIHRPYAHCAGYHDPVDRDVTSSQAEDLQVSLRPIKRAVFMVSAAGMLTCMFSWVPRRHNLHVHGTL